MPCEECGSTEHKDYRTCPKWRREGIREHFDKYELIARALGIEKLKVLVPATREEIVEALKTDYNLNNIPLGKWDAQHARVLYLVRTCKNEMFRANHARFWSLGDTVCVLKHVAKHHIAGVERP